MPARIDFPKPEHIDEVRKLAAWLTEEQLATFYGISARTLRRRFTENEELRLAWDQGNLESLVDSGTKLKLMIQRIGTENERNSDAAALFFHLKTRFGWRETRDLNVTTRDLSAALGELDDADDWEDEDAEADGDEE